MATERRLAAIRHRAERRRNVYRLTWGLVVLGPEDWPTCGELEALVEAARAAVRQAAHGLRYDGLGVEWHREARLE